MPFTGKPLLKSNHNSQDSSQLRWCLLVFTYFKRDSGHVYKPITATCIFKGTQTIPQGTNICKCYRNSHGLATKTVSSSTRVRIMLLLFFNEQIVTYYLMSEKVPSLLSCLRIPQFEHYMSCRIVSRETELIGAFVPSHSHTSGLVISENWKMKVLSKSMQNPEVGNAKPIYHTQWQTNVQAVSLWGGEKRINEEVEPSVNNVPRFQIKVSELLLSLRMAATPLQVLIRESEMHKDMWVACQGYVFISQQPRLVKPNRLHWRGVQLGWSLWHK